VFGKGKRKTAQKGQCSPDMGAGFFISPDTREKQSHPEYWDGRLLNLF
jgi:hypothetical protein